MTKALLALLILATSVVQSEGHLRGDFDERDFGKLEEKLRLLGGNDILTEDDDPYDDDGGSAPSPTPSTIKDCFSEMSTVQELTRGRLAMKDLRVGDKILTRNGHYQTVFAFAHREADRPSPFFQFHSKELERPLEITDHHLVYLHDKKNPVRAASIRVGDNLHTPHGPAEISKITTINRVGVYAPMTIDGTLVVDGVAASNYISFQKEEQETIHLMGWNTGLSHHDYAHMGLSPFRLISLGISSNFAQWMDDENGMPQHVSLAVKVCNWVFRQNIVVRVLVLALIVLVHGMSWLLECVFGPSKAPLAVMVLGILYKLRTRLRVTTHKTKSL